MWERGVYCKLLWSGKKAVSHCMSLSLTSCTLQDIHFFSYSPLPIFLFVFLDNLSSFPIHPGISAGRNLELSGNKVTVGVLKISFLQNITKVCIHIILILKGESCILFHNYVSVLCVSS